MRKFIMKKKLLLAILIILFISTGAWAAGKAWVKQGDSETASASVVTGAGLFHSIIFSTNGTNANTVNIYDNTAASGTKLIPTDTRITTSATDRIQTITFDPPVRFYTGIYVSVDSTIAYMVYFESE